MCANASRNNVLQFGLGDSLRNYRFENPDQLSHADPTMVAPLGEGGSAVVFRVKQTLHDDVSIVRAIKFFMYRDDIAGMTAHRHAGPVSQDDFLSEVVNLSNFSHENVLKIIDAGLHSVSSYSIPFIVTEFVDGPTLRDVLQSSSDPARSDSGVNALNMLRQTPSMLFNIILEIGAGLEHLHESGFAHCDVAPKNIFLRGQGNLKPIIGDLGIAKSLNSKRNQVLIAGSRDYMPEDAQKLLNEEVSWSTFRGLQPRWDIFAYAKTCLELCDLIESGSNHEWFEPLRSALQKCIDGDEYHSVNSLVERVRFLMPIHREVAAVPELAATVPDKARRILMPIEALATSKRVRKLVEHPALLRLAKVPQLTLAYQVFPGAMHTRYEHSLGVMETMRRYLLTLLGQAEFLEHLSKEKIETALVVALMANITRFPYSSIIHEIKGKHQSAFACFSKLNLLQEILGIPNNQGITFRSLLEDLFPSVDLQALSDILTGETKTLSPEDALIHSMLNCSLDVRVVDFVRRDSVHLGITKGDPLDLGNL